MKVTRHQMRDGTRYWMADGRFQGRRILVEATDRWLAIIGWINTANERATQCTGK